MLRQRGGKMLTQSTKLRLASHKKKHKIHQFVSKIRTNRWTCI